MISLSIFAYSSNTNLGDFVFSGFFIQINVFGIGMTSLANSSVSIRSVHFLTCSDFKSYSPDYNGFGHMISLQIKLQFLKFHDEITKIVRVLAPEIKIC